MVVAFFGTTILSVVLLRFLPVYFTPLMFIRLVQQGAGERNCACTTGGFRSTIFLLICLKR